MITEEEQDDIEASLLSRNISEQLEKISQTEHSKFIKEKKVLQEENILMDRLFINIRNLEDNYSEKKEDLKRYYGNEMKQINELKSTVSSLEEKKNAIIDKLNLKINKLQITEQNAMSYETRSNDLQSQIRDQSWAEYTRKAQEEIQRLKTSVGTLQKHLNMKIQEQNELQKNVSFLNDEIRNLQQEISSTEEKLTEADREKQIAISEAIERLGEEYNIKIKNIEQQLTNEYKKKYEDSEKKKTEMMQQLLHTIAQEITELIKITNAVSNDIGQKLSTREYMPENLNIEKEAEVLTLTKENEEALGRISTLTKILKFEYTHDVSLRFFETATLIEKNLRAFMAACEHVDVITNIIDYFIHFAVSLKFDNASGKIPDAIESTKARARKNEGASEMTNIKEFRSLARQAPFICNL